jgi:hypothetical protein
MGFLQLILQKRRIMCSAGSFKFVVNKILEADGLTIHAAGAKPIL